MTTKHAREEARAISSAVERQMKRWALEIQQLLEPDRALARLSENVHPYVAISRESGAGGGEIARLVAERLRCPCMGAELLAYVAERYGLPKTMLEFVDEKTSSWLYDVFGYWLHKRVVAPDEYVTHLGQVTLLAARDGTAVFVGRGAQFLLPRDKGLAVRIIAPLEQRIQRTMQRHHVDRDAAQGHIAAREEGRRDFIQRHFRQAADDPSVYDLVINLERLDREAAADLIVAAFHRRFGDDAGTKT